MRHVVLVDINCESRRPPTPGHRKEAQLTLTTRDYPATCRHPHCTASLHG